MIDVAVVKDIYRALRPNDISVGEEFTTFKTGQLMIKVENKEIIEYIEMKCDKHVRSEVMLSHHAFYEHAVDLNGNISNEFRGLRHDKEIVMKHNSKEFEVTLARPSSKFIINLTDVDKMSERIRIKVSLFSSSQMMREGSISLQKLFRNFMSIRVKSPIAHPISLNPHDLAKIAESASYNISCIYGMSISLLKSWERTPRYLESKDGETPSFPKRLYNAELVAHYQEALGTNNLVFSYLGLYKILEYCFTKTKEKLLHKKIRTVLASPDFDSMKTNHIRKLAKTIQNHEQSNKEKEVLRTVLQDNFTPEELIDWITDFNKKNNNYFSSDNHILKSEFKITGAKDKIYNEVTNRIYTIRNAIVHNKEEENIRYIPFSGFDKHLANEIKLVRHIAEELILRTGKEITL